MGGLFDLSSRRALVTGGGANLGRQMATALAECGATVVICGRRREPLEETAADLRAAGHAVEAVVADVTRDDDVARLRAQAGPVDVLVNNAGYSIRSPWLEVTREEWREVMAVNLEAPFRLAQAFAPGMIERGFGRIVNVASVYGVLAGDPSRYFELGLDIASYFASKHGLIGLTRHLAVVLGPSGVTVNALSPGMFPPPEGLVVRREAVEALAEATPLKRVGSETDLKGAIVFLASDSSSFVTGQNLIVDGGWTIW
jgi:NAD(P)-dependent dehydrogenase (short-subunit alcohol dehydrogenase family)